MSIESEFAAFDAGIRNSMKDVEHVTRMARDTRDQIEAVARQIQPIARPLTFHIAEGIRLEAEAMDRIFDSLRAVTRVVNPHYPRRRRA